MSRHSRLLRQIARENETDLPVGDTLTEEQLAAVEADTTLDVDTVTELEVPANDISSGFDEIEIAETDQESLETTAELANASLEDDGQGLDPTAAELISKEINIAAERYGLKRSGGFARESMNVVAGRKQVTRDLARESEEAAAGIGARIKEGAKALYEMLVKFITELFDKSLRYSNKAKAMQSKLASAKFKPVGQDTNVKLSLVKAEGGKWPSMFDGSANKMIETIKKAKTLAIEVGDHNTAIDIGVFNGTSWAVKREGATVSLESTPYEAEGFFKTVDQAGAAAILKSIVDALNNLNNAKSDFEAFREEVKKGIQTIDEHSGDKVRQANLRTVAKALTSVTKAFINTAGQGLRIVDQSFDTAKAEEPAAAASAVPATA